MRLSFLELPPDERRLYIEQAALRRNVSPVILADLENRINHTGSG